MSAWWATSCAILTRNPPCTWTAPLGRPVVPDVYMIIIGVSGSSGSDGHSAGSAATISSQSRWRASGGRVGVASPLAGDDDVADARAGVGGLARDRLQRDRLAAAERDVGGDQRHGLAVVEPGGDGLRAEAGEDRDRDRADLGAGQERDDGLRDHRQEQPDPVAPADPQPSQRPGQAAGLGVQLGVGQPADRPVLALPDHGGVVAAGRRAHGDRGNDAPG